MPEAVSAVYPRTLTQLRTVHLVRASLRHVSTKGVKAVVAALKRVYQSVSANEAALEQDALETGWGKQYRAVVRLWRGNWDNVIPYFQFPPEIRKVIYTTNAIESLNMSLRKLTRNRRIFGRIPNSVCVCVCVCVRSESSQSQFNDAVNLSPKIMAN